MGGANRAEYSCVVRSFLYLHCDDLGRARGFYTDVIGLTETFFSDEIASVGYQVGGLQVTVAHHPTARRAEGWASQLGWEGGTAGMPSWGFELPPKEFCRAVERALSRGVSTLHSEPEWVGYWSFPLRDPMGNTVELSTANRDAWGTD